MLISAVDLAYLSLRVNTDDVAHDRRNEPNRRN
jgi:hypothetical protein